MGNWELLMATSHLVNRIIGKNALFHTLVNLGEETSPLGTLLPSQIKL